MDEDVYGRIAPKKPRLWSFHEEQEELRNLTRDRKKKVPAPTQSEEDICSGACDCRGRCPFEDREDETTL